MKSQSKSTVRQLTGIHALGRELGFRTPYIPTKHRWLRWLLRAELGSSELWEMDLLGTEHKRVRVVPTTVLGRDILFFGLYERDYALAFRRLLKKGDTVLDVGANIGQYSLIASEMVGHAGRVLAIEPCGHVFDRLQGHLALNRASNVTAVRCAAGAESGCATLVVKADDNDGMHHLSRSADKAGESVPLRRLDDLVAEHLSGRTVDAIKIDVEGWEEAVFAGAPELLRQPRPPAIFFEAIEEHANRFGFSARRLAETFVAAGYRVFGLDEGSVRWREFDRTAAHWPCNLAALHPQRADQIARLLGRA